MCLEKDGLGFQVFNATNDTITLNTPTKEAMAKLSPNTPFTRAMGEYDAPLSNRKAREVLGFKERHNWRKVCRFRRRVTGRPLALAGKGDAQLNSSLAANVTYN